MKLSDFDYALPEELIAQYPIKERDQARLLVLERKSGRMEHRLFKDIGEYLSENDLLVLNDTKVLPARLIGKRQTGGRVEVLLLNRKSGMTFNAMVKPARLRTGESIIFNGGSISGALSQRDEVTFNAENEEAVYRLGTMPLPPYIKREVEGPDTVYYQTVYARNNGAIAAPTAGLHFTLELLDELKSAGVNLAYVTLHVGAGTFKPVKSEDILGHKMDPEYFKVSDENLALLEKAKNTGTRVVAVGTTSLRAIEANSLGQKEGFTDLFVYPGYHFNTVKGLLTNFHLPRTTLFMLVCAFAGEALAKHAYAEAISRKYRFYSYGDAMLVL